MKKNLRLFALVLLCLAALAAPPPSILAESAAGQAFSHPHKALPLYQRADDDKKPLRVLGTGEAFLLLAQKDGWAEIRSTTKRATFTGFVRAKGLQPLAPDAGMDVACWCPRTDGASPAQIGQPAGNGAGKYSPGVWYRL